MKKGYSIKISEQNVDVKSFISEDYDNLYLKTASFDFLFEGVLLNRKKLLNEFALKDFETLIGELYFLKKENIIKEFEGEFRGFIFDKVQQKLFVFTNATSTQRVFYGEFKGEIFIDTSLIRLSENLKNSGFQPTPNLESVYQMLCFNGLLERSTIIQDVHKILDGHFLKIDLKNLDKKEIQYFTTFNEGCFSGSKKKASQIIHEIFKESVLMEYSKDTELGKNHLSLLSGGLDSRVAMMYALKNNQSIENVLCFSQSGYIDHTVSRKIAEDYRLHYEFIPLNGGKFLKKIDELTQISEGMVMYTGGIHVNHAVDEMQYENFALFHSGQLGDALLGGYLSAPERKRPSNYKIVGNPQFLGKVETLLNETKKNYESEESFLIRNRGYNTVLLGAHVFQQKRYQTSPFMAKDFLKFAAALPEEWKYNHRFYLEWIQKHCKEATKYRWERTLLKPDANWKTSFGDKFVKRSFKLLNEKILKTPQKSSMYPYQYYFDNDTEIQNYYKNYFEDNIHRIEDYKELESDVKELFQSENFYSKSQSVNILAIFKLFF